MESACKTAFIDSLMWLTEQCWSLRPTSYSLSDSRVPGPGFGYATGHKIFHLADPFFWLLSQQDQENSEDHFFP